MINEQLLDLYRKYYGNAVNNIIPCGLVDEETYSGIYPKIVYVLREPHSDETGWSLRDGLKRNVEKGINGIPLEPGYMHTWRQAGVWAHAIIYGFNSYDVLKKDLYVAKGLQAIGMTNLKKTGGGASSNLGAIRYYANKEKDLWQTELEIMNPDIVICGSTYQDVQKNLSLYEQNLATIDSKRYSYSVWGIGKKKRIIIDFWHPGIRGNRNQILNDLKILVDKLKEKGYLRG